MELCRPVKDSYSSGHMGCVLRSNSQNIKLPSIPEVLNFYLKLPIDNKINMTLPTLKMMPLSDKRNEKHMMPLFFDSKFHIGTGFSSNINLYPYCGVESNNKLNNNSNDYHQVFFNLLKSIKNEERISNDFKNDYRKRPLISLNFTDSKSNISSLRHTTTSFFDVSSEEEVDNLKTPSKNTTQSTKTKFKRNNLPREKTAILLKWLDENLSYPYPSSQQKSQLMSSTGLNQQQLSNWFINARRRKIKFLKYQKTRRD